MSTNKKDDDSLKQPLMSTGTTEAGYKKEETKTKAVTQPKIGETIMGDDGITGRIR